MDLSELIIGIIIYVISTLILVNIYTSRIDTLKRDLKGSIDELNKQIKSLSDSTNKLALDTTLTKYNPWDRNGVSTDWG